MSNDMEVAGIIARLLQHYYSPGELSDGALRAMAQDWIEDLIEFAPLIVAEACREWRRSHDRKPVISNIRQFCIELQRRQRERITFAARQMPDEPRKKYRESMTDAEKRQWHAEIYAWRRVRLGASRDERTSPPDPAGDFFDETLVDQAEQRLRQKADGERTARNRKRDAEMLEEAKQIKDAWARDHGYADCEDYMAQEKLDYSDACKSISTSIMANAVLRNRQAFGEAKGADPRALLHDLGATKPERTYTAEEMRRARVALGLELDHAPPAAEAAE